MYEGIHPRAAKQCSAPKINQHKTEDDAPSRGATVFAVKTAGGLSSWYSRLRGLPVRKRLELVAEEKRQFIRLAMTTAAGGQPHIVGFGLPCYNAQVGIESLPVGMTPKHAVRHALALCIVRTSVREGRLVVPVLGNIHISMREICVRLGLPMSLVAGQAARRMDSTANALRGVCRNAEKKRRRTNIQPARRNRNSMLDRPLGSAADNGALSGVGRLGVRKAAFFCGALSVTRSVAAAPLTQDVGPNTLQFNVMLMLGVLFLCSMQTHYMGLRRALRWHTNKDVDLIVRGAVRAKCSRWYMVPGCLTKQFIMVLVGFAGVGESLAAPIYCGCSLLERFATATAALRGQSTEVSLACDKHKVADIGGNLLGTTPKEAEASNTNYMGELHATSAVRDAIGSTCGVLLRISASDADDVCVGYCHISRDRNTLTVTVVDGAGVSTNAWVGVAADMLGVKAVTHGECAEVELCGVACEGEGIRFQPTPVPTVRFEMTDEYRVSGGEEIDGEGMVVRLRHNDVVFTNILPAYRHDISGTRLLQVPALTSALLGTAASATWVNRWARIGMGASAVTCWLSWICCKYMLRAQAAEPVGEGASTKCALAGLCYALAVRQNSTGTDAIIRIESADGVFYTRLHGAAQGRPSVAIVGKVPWSYSTAATALLRFTNNAVGLLGMVEGYWPSAGLVAVMVATLVSGLSGVVVYAWFVCMSCALLYHAEDVTVRDKHVLMSEMAAGCWIVGLFAGQGGAVLDVVKAVVAR